MFISNSSIGDIFGHETVNGTMHIYSVADLFSFGEKFGEVGSELGLSIKIN